LWSTDAADDKLCAVSSLGYGSGEDADDDSSTDSRVRPTWVDRTASLWDTSRGLKATNASSFKKIFNLFHVEPCRTSRNSDIRLFMTNEHKKYDKVCGMSQKQSIATN